jgi:hypothetical protein
MNNQERKLFNIATKIEKLLYEHCDITNFNKELVFDNLIIDTGRKVLNWEFLEPFIDLTKKEDINFFIMAKEECLQIKIYM